jgi:Zn-dependent protease
MDAQAIVQNLVITMPIFLLSLSVHEAAHAAAADYLGDPTARYQGRVTLNPLSHIDWIGTVLMPILSAVSGGIAMIGWAKPVPVDWRNLRNIRRDDTIIAIAGPASNVVLSFVCFLGLAALLMANVGGEPGSIGALAVRLLRYGIIINIALAVFNMIPIPPLDGSHVVANVLPEHLSEKYRSIGFYGVFLLLILLNFTPLKTLLNVVIRAIDGGYVHLLNTIVGA